jgi:DNA-binding MarR family transcriptional regulator
VGKPLSPDEYRTFHSALAIADTLRNRMAHEMGPASGLSSADFIVLNRLRNSPGQTYAGLKLLAAKLGWSTSRLSHQVSRMERRGLVTRQQTDNAGQVIITLTDQAKDIMADAVLVHADAVRRYLLTQLTEKEAHMLNAVADRLRELPGG